MERAKNRIQTTMNKLKTVPFCTIFFVFLSVILTACQPENPLQTILSSPTKEIATIVENIDAHHIQIRYTQIHRDTLGQPQFRSYEYGVDEERYFYPASTAKLPVAILALQRLRELQRKGVAIDAQTPFLIRSPLSDHPMVESDSTHPQHRLTVAHLIKKIFLVSDNDAYNYLFDFLGRDYINDQLREKGLNQIQIHHKFLWGADNERTWEYLFYDAAGTVYEQASMRSIFAQTNDHLKGVRQGNGFIKEGNLVTEPMDFRQKNRLSIRALEGLMKRVLFPEVFPAHQRFDLTEEDHVFLRYWMGRHTLESSSPKYSAEAGFYDSYVKFLMYGDTPGKMTPDIRIYNKVGDAYGTLTDTAYIVDAKAEIEFLLTATVFVNKNGIFNDDVYEYDALGIPFLGALGRQVYAWEKKTKSMYSSGDAFLKK